MNDNMLVFLIRRRHLRSKTLQGQLHDLANYTTVILYYAWSSGNLTRSNTLLTPNLEKLILNPVIVWKMDNNVFKQSHSCEVQKTETSNWKYQIFSQNWRITWIKHLNHGVSLQLPCAKVTRFWHNMAGLSSCKQSPSIGNT